MNTNPRYNKAVAVVPSDSVDFGFCGKGTSFPEGVLCDALYVGGGGIVAAVLADGTVQNHTCIAGEILPLRLRRVNATGTTATLMQALYSI